MNDNTSHQAICVLGAHRSGTSTITRGLNLLGAYLGEENDIMKPLPENPEGFWERLDIFHLQNHIMAIMKREWDSTVPLPVNWHKTDDIRPFKKELFDLVKKNFSDRQLWLWKDPRTCLLLPLWKEVLSDLAINLKVVFVVRNPLDVARSLEKRNGFTTDKGLGVWYNCTISALQGLEGLDTIFLSYDRFLDDWETELKRCSEGLGIAWPTDDTVIKAKMASFVRNDLRHSATSLDELRAVSAPEPVILLFELLLEVLSGRVAIDAVGSLSKSMYRDFFAYARFFDNDMDELVEFRARLDKEVKVPREQVTFSQKSGVAQSPCLGTNDNQLQEILNSLSWKITKPLRILHALLRKQRKGQ